MHESHSPLPIFGKATANLQELGDDGKRSEDSGGLNENAAPTMTNTELESTEAVIRDVSPVVIGEMVRDVSSVLGAMESSCSMGAIRIGSSLEKRAAVDELGPDVDLTNTNRSSCPIGVIRIG